MRVFWTLATVVFVVGAFGVMMHIKTDVINLLKTRKKLAYEKIHLNEALRVLEAEKAYLMRPQRLDVLAQELKLQDMVLTQVSLGLREVAE